MKKRQYTINEPPLKNAVYQVAGTMRSGIQFTAKTMAGRNTLFFWSPAPDEVFAKWDSGIWVILPPDRIPAKRRAKLVEFARSRGQG
jgi:hypothetical protein